MEYSIQMLKSPGDCNRLKEFLEGCLTGYGIKQTELIRSREFSMKKNPRLKEEGEALAIDKDYFLKEASLTGQVEYFNKLCNAFSKRQRKHEAHCVNHSVAAILQKEFQINCVAKKIEAAIELLFLLQQQIRACPLCRPQGKLNTWSP